jgi:hypothetical protein
MPGAIIRSVSRHHPDHSLPNVCLVSQVIEVCRRANPKLVVKRARFSALILRDLQRAVNNLVEPNEMDSKAVDARQEIDLRIGASFTRFQTLLLQVSVVIFSTWDSTYNWAKLKWFCQPHTNSLHGICILYSKFK